MPLPSLNQQFAFLREIDQLKNVIRKSPLLDGSRKENSAEHSWHLAMYALVLHEYAVESVNLERVIQMLLIHDIVEVDVGDMPIHDATSGASQTELEGIAATRLFGMIQDEQGSELLALWHEFELAESSDARFAKALDRVQPLLANVSTGGGTWTESDVTLDQVFERYGPIIARGSPTLWNACQALVREHFATIDGEQRINSDA